MDILKEILDRRSVRQFKSDSIESDKLERILEAGRLAPSAKNRQQWRFIVINDEDIREKLKKAAFGQEHVGQAPVMIAACTTNIDYKMPNGQLSYPIDMSFAVSFMALQAVKEGLGTCCVTTFDEQLVKYVLTVPHAMKVVMLLLVGYPGDEGEAQSRKPANQVVSYNHW